MRLHPRNLLIGLGFLTACSALEAGHSHFPDQDGGAQDGGADRGAIDTDGGGGGVAMGGQWALFVEGRQCLTVIGAVVENVIWNWSRVEVVEEGVTGGGARLLRQHVQLCSSELSPLVGGLLSRVPDRVVDSLRVEDGSAFLVGEGETQAYLGDEVATLWGMSDFDVSLPMPVDAADGRVIDQDADGKPGVTLQTTNRLGETVCEVELIQRTRVRLDGRIEPNGMGGGGAWVQVDQRVLDATNPICRANSTLTQSANPSRFMMVRMDGQGGAPLNLDLDGDGIVTCREVRTSIPVLEEALQIERATPDPAACP